MKCIPGLFAWSSAWKEREKEENENPGENNQSPIEISLDDQEYGKY